MSLFLYLSVHINACITAVSIEHHYHSGLLGDESSGGQGEKSLLTHATLLMQGACVQSLMNLQTVSTGE